MKNILLTICLGIALILSAQGNTAYDKAMTKGFENMQKGEFIAAANQFDLIAAKMSDNWIPRYYAMHNRIIAMFMIKDEAEYNAHKAKVEDHFVQMAVIEHDEIELAILDNLMKTTLLVLNPMVYGAKLSPEIMAKYTELEKKAPDNLRVRYLKVQFEMGGAQFWGKDLEPYCTQLREILPLFEQQGPTKDYYPSWGMYQVKEALESDSCTNK